MYDQFIRSQRLFNLLLKSARLLEHVAHSTVPGTYKMTNKYILN